MSSPSAISGVFGKPFAEQVAFFRNKLGNLVPTTAWDDIEGAAHDTGFMVAGAVKADLLSDLAAATDKAITEGRGIEEFRRDFKSIVAKNGWTGWTGEGSVKGEAWRVGVIYRTNMYTSYSAGRFAQLTAGNFAYWVYRHGGSRDPRPEHLSWNGMALEPAHVFWSTHYPPSDWGCSCYVVGARTAAAVGRLGGDLAKKLPANWQARDPKTGAPVGIGKGWGYAPGASVADIIQKLAPKIGNWDHQIAKAFLNSLPDESADAISKAYRALPSTQDDARRYAQRVFAGTEGGTADMRPLPPVRTMGLVPSNDAARIQELTKTEVAGFDYVFDTDGVKHVLRRHTDQAVEAASGQRAVTASDFALLPRVLSDPDAITRSSDTGSAEAAVVYEKVISGEKYVVVMAARGQRRKQLALKTMYIKVRWK